MVCFLGFFLVYIVLSCHSVTHLYALHRSTQWGRQHEEHGDMRGDVRRTRMKGCEKGDDKKSCRLKCAAFSQKTWFPKKPLILVFAASDQSGENKYFTAGGPALWKSQFPLQTDRWLSNPEIQKQGDDLQHFRCMKERIHYMGKVNKNSGVFRNRIDMSWKACSQRWGFVYLHPIFQKAEVQVKQKCGRRQPIYNNDGMNE